MAESFGEYLAYWRKRNGLTQRALAEKCRIDYTYVCKLEKGGGWGASDETLGFLAEALLLPEASVFLKAGKIPPRWRRAILETHTEECIRFFMSLEAQGNAKV